MALLVAIFRARPSPFYVLDEIEAALDDVNLRRLILLMEELRATSQLIVITHQKPTMEVADASTASPCAATASRRSSRSGCAPHRDAVVGMTG